MILMIDPPVTPFSSHDEIRAWISELEAMRAQHARDPEALGCIRRAEWHARLTLELAGSSPPIEPPVEG